MGFSELLEKLITEHGSSAILKEHLEFVKTKLASEIDDFKLQIENLESDVQQLKAANHRLTQERDLANQDAQKAKAYADYLQRQLNNFINQSSPPNLSPDGFDLGN